MASAAGPCRWPRGGSPEVKRAICAKEEAGGQERWKKASERRNKSTAGQAQERHVKEGASDHLEVPRKRRIDQVPEEAGQSGEDRSCPESRSSVPEVEDHPSEEQLSREPIGPHVVGDGAQERRNRSEPHGIAQGPGG